MKVSYVERAFEAFSRMKRTDKIKWIAESSAANEIPGHVAFLILLKLGLTPEQAVIALGWVK